MARGWPAADYLVACDLPTTTASALVDTDGDSTGAIYALTADTDGVLYAGGTFINMDTIAAAYHVASYSSGAWHAMGGPDAVNGIVRSLTAQGTDVYVGTDAVDIGGIPQADHVARWDGLGTRSGPTPRVAGDGSPARPPSPIR